MNVNQLESILEKDGIVFLTYGGFLTQSLIVGMTEALERESENSAMSMKIANSIFTIFIELSQNMMNYSKSKLEEGAEFDPKGMIVVGKDKENRYYIMSRNIIDIEDKKKIEKKLQKIQESDLAEIKRLYKEARRSGKDSHHRGGGIGFYEIAKKSSSIEYDFSKINETKYYFTFKAIL
jgi:hypothetical protein